MVLSKRNKKRADINELTDNTKDDALEDIPKLQESLKNEIENVKAKKVRLQLQVFPFTKRSNLNLSKKGRWWAKARFLFPFGVTRAFKYQLLAPHCLTSPMSSGPVPWIRPDGTR